MSGKGFLPIFRQMADFLFPGDPPKRRVAVLFFDHILDRFIRQDSVGGSRLRRRTFVVVAALLFDAVLGDPPSRFHPVAWMGAWNGFFLGRAPQGSDAVSLLYGAGTTAAGAALAWLGGRWLGRKLRAWPYGWLVEAAVLSLVLAWRGLMRAGGAVAQELEDGDLRAARRQLGRHLVSRDVSRLDEGLVAAAAIESLAENTSDSVVAPLFWYGLGGLPAALVYRFLNTADAQMGYRDPAREWLGKCAARLDDIANLIPSRLTALLIVAAAPIAGGSRGTARRTRRLDARRTASPNAGHPMSAAAGALGIELEKRGQYRLGEGLPQPRPHDIRRSQKLLSASIVLGVLTAVSALFLTSIVRESCASHYAVRASQAARETENG